VESMMDEAVLVVGEDLSRGIPLGCRLGCVLLPMLLRLVYEDLIVRHRYEDRGGDVTMSR
jgi:hypothetical protein